MSSKGLWIAAIASTVLAACNTAQTHIADEDPGIGEAVRYDAAVQTINPAPVYAANSTQPGSNGEMGAKAVQRYRSDKVKEPAAQNPSGSISGSGAGSGSGPQ